MIIYITGKSNSGKGYIALQIAVEYPNVHYLDIDKVGHSVHEIDSVRKKEIEAFGEDIFENGIVNRKKLGKIVFNDKDAMKKLEEITGPYMKKVIDKFIEEHKEDIILLDYFRITEYFDLSDLKLLVEAPYEVRLERAMNRNKITKEKFDEREKNSTDYSNYKFDMVISNDGSSIDKELLKIKKYIKECE